MAIDEKERLRRWRLVLGKEAAKGEGSAAGKSGHGSDEGFDLNNSDRAMDSVLEALYEIRTLRRPGQFIAQRRPLAGRHPHLLPILSCACHAAGCLAAFEPDPDVDGARNPGDG